MGEALGLPIYVRALSGSSPDSVRSIVSDTLRVTLTMVGRAGLEPATGGL